MRAIVKQIILGVAVGAGLSMLWHSFDEPVQQQEEESPAWHGGGTLTNSWLWAFRNTDPANQMATAADFVAELRETKPEWQTMTMDDLAPFSAELSHCLWIASNREGEDGIKIHRAVANCIEQLGW